MPLWIEEDLCNACKACLRACPYGALEMRDGKAHILERCTSCGACLEVCKQKAIFSDIEPKIIPDFSDWQGVWVFAEQSSGRLNPVSLELLGKAQEMAESLGQNVSAVLLGHQVGGLSKILFEYGARNVYLAQQAALKHFRATAYTKVLSELVKEYKPNIFLLGATPLGRDLAPRLSRRVESGLTADCTDLTIDPEENTLLQTRPAFGGNVMATIVNRYSRPQMATVRPGVMKAKRTGASKGKTIRFKPSITEKEIGTKILEVIREKKKSVNLNETKVIVAGGRGVGSKSGLKPLFELAGVMGGEVAGSRLPIEEGWLSSDRQVGQTGQTVRPEIYIACGISGAIQHRAGMMDSRYIIAINRDKGAPIFEVADWGIVGDLHKIVPALTKAIKAGK